MKQYDLTDCDLEPIHLIGRVQPHAALLAFDNSWTITHASQSLADYLGEAPEEVIGRSLVSVLPHELVHDLRTKLQLANGSELVLGLRDVALNGQRFDLAISNTAGKTVLDIERHSGTVPDGELNLISSIAERVPDGVPVPQMTQAIARAFRALTGYDRTMVYRFAEDGSGEVIAEATAPGVEPYLGLRYPDTDIPAQARALLLRNRVRLIADSADPGVPIMGLGDLDLSLSGIRAVSPIHLEYLRNMGVASSMTVSLIVGGRLWGLVACHHRKPFVVPMATRGAADLLGRLLAHKIGLRLAEEELEAISRTGSLQKTLLTHDGGGASVADNLPFIARSVAGDIAFDSIAFLHDGHLELAGEPLPRRQAEAAMRQLQPLVGSEIWHTDKLAHFLPNLPLAGMAGAETCRSVSAAWQVGGTAYTTRIWTTGDHGCKRIEHTITTPEDIETLTGLDCNCDLIADGQETRIEGSPHPYTRPKLEAVCRGPMAEPHAPPR